MTQKTERPGYKNTLYCSFCGKSQHEVRKLIAGPTVFICDECVELCSEIIQEEINVKHLEPDDRYPILFGAEIPACFHTGDNSISMQDLFDWTDNIKVKDPVELNELFAATLITLQREQIHDAVVSDIDQVEDELSRINANLGQYSLFPENQLETLRKAGLMALESGEFQQSEIAFLRSNLNGVEKALEIYAKVHRLTGKRDYLYSYLDRLKAFKNRFEETAAK